jgi:hypothetical protein
MSAQLTLQAPLALPPTEVSPYLEQLWDSNLEASSGAATFVLIVWDPAWLEQQLVRCGRIDGPISGLVSPELLEAARLAVSDCGLPPSTAPMDCPDVALDWLPLLLPLELSALPEDAEFPFASAPLDDNVPDDAEARKDAATVSAAAGLAAVCIIPD